MSSRASGSSMRPCSAIALAFAALGLLAGCERTEPVQRGFRGTGEVQMIKPSAVAALKDLNAIPEAEDPADPDSPMATEVFKNIQILKDEKATEVSRLMQAMSTWVAPEEGCDFCHNPDKLESDEKYPKVVARQMLLMTREINSKWKAHVGETGVTCWTCHRGQQVPSGDWFASPGPTATANTQANFSGKNIPAPNAGNSALPYDPLSYYLAGASEVRVQASSPLTTGMHVSIKEAEKSYALMMYISQALGVNCTYCHNTRAMGRWDESMPARATAWHGIRMTRRLNNGYLIPVKSLLPDHRLSAEGDGPKVGCATCHKGTYKPLYGKSPLTDYPILAYSEPPAPPPPPSRVGPATDAGVDKLSNEPRPEATSPIAPVSMAPVAPRQ